MLIIAVESEADKTVICALLGKAEIQKYEMIVVEGKFSPNKITNLLNQKIFGRGCISVYNQDNGSVADAKFKFSSIDPTSRVAYCPAIPTVAAWLFADSEALFNVLGKKAEPFIGRMPLPEQLPYPNFLKHSLLREPHIVEHLLEKMDLLIAGARSPSLKYFIQTARTMSGLPEIPFDQSSNPASQISKEILRNLISEVYPSDKALFRSASGAVITAEQMMQEITDGSELGREYSSDILRVARDLLSRQAQKTRGGT